MLLFFVACLLVSLCCVCVLWLLVVVVLVLLLSVLLFLFVDVELLLCVFFLGWWLLFSVFCFLSVLFCFSQSELKQQVVSYYQYACVCVWGGGGGGGCMRACVRACVCVCVCLTKINLLYGHIDHCQSSHGDTTDHAWVKALGQALAHNQSFCATGSQTTWQWCGPQNRPYH